MVNRVKINPQVTDILVKNYKKHNLFYPTVLFVARRVEKNDTIVWGPFLSIDKFLRRKNERKKRSRKIPKHPRQKQLEPISFFLQYSKQNLVAYPFRSPGFFYLLLLGIVTWYQVFCQKL